MTYVGNTPPDRTVKPCVYSRFDGLVHTTAVPSLDVADVQRQIYTKLKVPYNNSSGLFKLLVHEETVRTTPVGTQQLSQCTFVLRQIPVFRQSLLSVSRKLHVGYHKST